MKNLIMICALLLGSTVANAGGLIEPYIGYGNSKFEGTLAAGLGTIEAKSKGPVLGLRAGYQFVLPWVALDVSQYNGDGEDGASDIKVTDMGVTAGVSLPIIRPYAGYVLSSKAKTDTSEFTGTAMKFGVGLGFIPLLHLNIEMVNTEYKEIDGNDIAATFSDNKTKSTVVTLSYVF